LPESLKIYPVGQCLVRCHSGSLGDRTKIATFDRMKHKVERSEAVGQAKAALAGEDIDDRFAKLEKEEEIERMLAEIKQRRGTA